MILLRLIRESYLFALQAIITNKTRTILSLLGITIGIFCVISVFTVFDSMERSIRQSIATLGDDVLFVQKWPWAMGGDYPWWKYWQRPEADLNDLDAIKDRSLASDASAFMVAVQKTIKFESNAIEDVSVIAVSHDYEKVMPLEIERGRYFTPMESAAGRPVAIIGSKIADNLMPDVVPVGKKIKIFGMKLHVIGLLKEEGEDMFGNSSDEQVFIPVNFARNYIDLNETGNTIIVRAKPNVSLDELRDELTGIMRSARKLKPQAENNFAINETSVISQGFDELFGIIATVGWIIGGFSLLVGGFGIANIMFVSVKERTSQIGIQKSLGAKNYFILLQFLFEAIFLSLFGGLVGLLIILAGTILVSNMGMELVLTQANIILGVSVSVIIGLVSGFVPAWNASRLDPVEAMRSTF